MTEPDLLPGPPAQPPPATRNSPRNRIAALLPLVLLAVFAALLWNGSGRWNAGAMLAFTAPLLNTLTLCLALLLPVPAFVLILWRWRGLARVFGGSAVGFLVIPASLLIPLVWLFEGHAMSPADDATCQLLRKVAMDRTEVVAYRTNGGATTDYGILVQQELPLFCGLRLVRVLENRGNQYDAMLEVQGRDSVRVTLFGSEGGVDADTLQLKAWSPF
ncbi:MAG: hypothetical protein ABI992_03365 [Chthoniobacterales bacterium]